VKRKILYVEDEPFLGKIVMETLENQGFEVKWETDGNVGSFFYSVPRFLQTVLLSTI
jgi:DNA-binding response OmpR family regulator